MGARKKLPAFNRQERNGIFYLLLCILLLQLAYYLIVHLRLGSREAVFHIDPNISARLLEKADSVIHNPRRTAYPFNPNFLSDYKGYVLGLSLTELDRLIQYRAGGNYLGSPAEFQKVTGISDSLLSALAPLMRFGQLPASTVKSTRKESVPNRAGELKREDAEVRELNSATASQLRTIRGIGPVLSERIIRFRDALGGFLTEMQLLDVYGLDPQVADRAMARFKVLEPPAVEKININTATADELAKNVYITYGLARAIVRRRERSGPFASLDELSGLEGFPKDKIARISLYLSL